MDTQQKIYNIYKELLDIPESKVEALLLNKPALEACYLTITKYGYSVNHMSYSIFYTLIEDILSEEFDYEFTEKQYKNLTSLKNL